VEGHRPRARDSVSAAGLHRVPGEGLVFTEPKTDRSRRTIAVPAPLIEALRKHRDAQN
jgi:integrase